MDQLLTLLEVRAREMVLAFRFAVMPDDRPSPLFPMFDVILNGGLLVWSLALLCSRTCNVSTTRWVALGVVNILVNMLFAIGITVRTRQKINAGILLQSRSFLLFALEPVVIAYAAFLLWEMVWMIIAGSMSRQRLLDDCASHLNVQLGFFVVYFLGGCPLFGLTFVTEFLKSPRWRMRAHLQWFVRNRPSTAQMGPSNSSQHVRMSGSTTDGLHTQIEKGRLQKETAASQAGGDLISQRTANADEGFIHLPSSPSTRDISPIPVSLTMTPAVDLANAGSTPIHMPPLTILHNGSANTTRRS